MTDTYDPDQPEYEEEYEDEQEEDQEEEQAAAPLVPIRGQAPIPMGEVDTGEALHGLVAFTRSVNLGMRDDNAHFRIEMPFLVQPGWSWPTIAAMAADAFFHAKATIYEQAGLPFTVDEGGVLRETLRHHFPDAEPVATPAKKRAAAPAARTPTRPQRPPVNNFPHPRDMEQPSHIADELWDDLVENYDDGWYDNRPQKDTGEYLPTASDFVRASDRKSLWLKPFKKAPAGAGAHSGGQRRRSYDD